MVPGGRALLTLSPSQLFMTVLHINVSSSAMRRPIMRLSPFALSAELPANIAFGIFFLRIVEHCFGVAILDQVASAPATRSVHVHKRRLIGHTSGLLRLVSHNRDGVILLELLHQLFNATSCNRVQRGTRLVHQ